MKRYKKIILLLPLLTLCFHSFAQKGSDKEQQKSDRNVMLNASNNTGPRDVNIGLPAGVGGTTILENGLPVVFFFWPEFPSNAWRSDAMLNKVQLFDLNQTALHVGDIGFSLSTFDNLGTDKMQVKGSVNSNHFGLVRNAINVSGPITEKGLKFSAGAYTSFDPGSFKPEGVDRYYADKTHLYKFALSQSYKNDRISGTTSVLYKYINSKDLSSKYSPFIYRTNGKVKELDNFTPGRDSYYENSGNMSLINAHTGKHYTQDIVNDYGSRSNTIDLISNNTLANGLNMNFILRYRESRSARYGYFTQSVDMASSRNANERRFSYEDGGEAYQGNAQAALILASRRTPIRSFLSQFEVGKTSGKHAWKAAIQESYYNVDKFITETAQYYQEVAPNPRKLILEINKEGVWKQEGKTFTIGSGNYNENLNLEYHNGHENKHALLLIDKWSALPVLDVTLGARVEYHTVRGDRLDRTKLDPATNEKYTTIAANPKIKIDDNWFKKAFMANVVYKMTQSFGLTAEACYNEAGGQLESYSSGADPELKKSKIPEAALGVYFNHPLISLVSKASYIKRNEYRTTVNFSNPNDPSEVIRPMTHYDIETIGWTTDAIVKPFKGFDLHLLFTYQAPKYKNFSGTVKFDDGAISNYDFSDKTVTGISRVLIEIDPSYTYEGLKVWASARYFSKQYMNKPNTLYFADRWETFAGVNYRLSKNLDISCQFVNLLNDKGASGAITDGDLVLTKEAAEKRDGTIMAGKYIRPFTVEFGLNYRF